MTSSPSRPHRVTVGAGLAPEVVATKPEMFLLRSVVRTAVSAIIALDEQGRVQLWNPAAVAMFGWREHEAMGKPVADLIIPDRHRAAHVNGLRHFLDTGHGDLVGGVVRAEARHADGTELPVEIAISLAWRDGARCTFVAFLKDITEQSEYEDDLRAAREQSSAYVDTLVHELRGPLTVISGYASLVSDETSPLPPTAMRTALSAIDRKAAEATELVNRLLLAARAESGGLPVEIDSIDLREAARAAMQRAADRARLAGATVHADCPGEPVLAWGDAKHISTILDNLVNNALVHGGPSPTIRLHVDAVDPVVAVENSGTPIPAELRARLFNRFTQLRTDNRSPGSGSGLGLYLSRLLAEIQGGTLNLDDDMSGEGNRFRFRLRSVADPDPIPPTRRSAQPDGNRSLRPPRGHDILAWRRRLSELDEVKSRFLNLMAHEFRGPLAVVRGYASMLAEGTFGPADAADLRLAMPVMSQKLEEMNVLVDQMLETARLENHRRPLEREPLYLRDVVQQAIRATARLAQDHRIVTAWGAGPDQVLGDRSRLVTIVTKLLDNACKYSPRGRDVRVRTGSTDQEVTVSIEDEGFGIAATDMPILFTQFGRIVTPENSHIPGSGLGLHFSQQLARLQGGRITVVSESGAGTTFTLHLPALAPEGRPSPAQDGRNSARVV